MTLLEKIKKLALSLDEVEGRDISDSGENFRIFITEDGKEIHVDEDGYATINDEKAAAGEYKLNDGNVMSVDGEGVMKIVDKVEVKDEEKPVEAPVAIVQADETVETDGVKETDTDALDAIHREINELFAIVDKLAKKVGETPESIREEIDEIKEDLRSCKEKLSATPSVQPISQHKNFPANMSMDEKLKLVQDYLK